MSALTAPKSRSRRARHAVAPVGLLVAAALLVPSGAQAAGSSASAKAPVAQTAKKHCRGGKRAVRRHHRWVCKRVAIHVSVPAPQPAPAPAPSPAPQPSQPAQPTIVDVSHQQADGWARGILARGVITNYYVYDCQAVNDTHGFCHVDMTLPGGVAVVEKYILNTYTGGNQVQNVWTFLGRFPLT